MQQIVEEFQRLSGVAPSLLERTAADPMLGVLAKAFSVRSITPADVKFIRYRQVGKGIELEDKAARLGGILTSVEPSDADPSTLMAFLKKHGAKPAPKVEEVPWDDESLDEAMKQWGLLGKPHQEALKKGYVNLHLVHPANAKKLTADNLAAPIMSAMMARQSNVAYLRDPQGILGKSQMSIPELKKWIVAEWASYFGEESMYASEAENWEQSAKLHSMANMMAKAQVKIDPIKGKTGTPGYRVTINPHPYKLRVESVVEQSEASPASIILQQMGGSGRLKAMIGAKHFISHHGGKALSFQFPNRKRTRGNFVMITLRPDDTYDMEFSKIANYEAKPVKKYSGIMADQLKPIFEKQTGLRLSLGF